LDEADLLIEEESKLESAKILYENGRYGDAVSRAYFIDTKPDPAGFPGLLSRSSPAARCNL
jgi:hypothetical protein